MNPLLLIPLLCSTACATLTGPSNAEVSARRAEDDALEAASRDPAYLSTENGFELTRWGMSEADVRALYLTAQVSSPDELVLPTLVDGRPATLDFGFVRGKLAQVKVDFTGSAAPDTDCADLVRQLASRFGAAIVQHDTRSEALSKLHDRELKLNVAGFADGLVLDPVQLAFTSVDLRSAMKQVETERAAVARAPSAYDATWVGHESRVDLTYRPGTPVQLKAVYQSRALGWSFEQQQAQRAEHVMATTAS